MDIGLREWLVVIGVIVIAAILFDGWRRMVNHKTKLKFKLDHNLADLLEPEDPTVGSVRAVKNESEPSVPFTMPSLHDRPIKVDKVDMESRQGALKLEAPLPTLLSPVEVQPKQQHVSKSSVVSTRQEIFIVHVVARQVEGFKGPALLQSILESGLRFGEMDIFHRHESMAGNGEILFSMANGVNPGTFDLDDMDLFTTPAVSFFFQLPGPKHPKQAFDLLLASARKLAAELEGELKDDQRSVMTAQTIEHYRYRISEFERKKMSQRG